jgi:L-asparaginase II
MLKQPAVNPVLVKVPRGEEIESFHRGAVAIVNANGETLAAWGDVERPIFPRSAAKMIQALPLIESGAADRFGLSDAHIALACASHSGEPGHVHAVEAWLAQIGLSSHALACGAQTPLDEKAARDLAARGEEPTALHNNCSGKHAGFLSTARHLGAPIEGYTARSHPVQKIVTHALSEMTECNVEAAYARSTAVVFPPMPFRCVPSRWQWRNWPLRNASAACARPLPIACSRRSPRIRGSSPAAAASIPVQ